MIWLTLRQFRLQGAIAGAALVVFGALLALTGPGMADDYDKGIARCTPRGDCERWARHFLDHHQAFYLLLLITVTAAPALIGAFWGAPLITRELETGTHRLVWNQTVTRTRWLAVKLGLVGLTAMATATLGGLALGWWAGPVEKASIRQAPRLSPLMFDSRGIAPLGYAAFAFALGIVAGVLLRRTLPAMAVTLVVFTAVQLAVPHWIRPHYLPPVQKTIAITSENVDDLILAEGDHLIVHARAGHGAWEMGDHTVDAAGKTVAAFPRDLSLGACAPDPAAMGPPDRCFTEAARLGYRQKVVYQPANRFWTFQWIETGLFLVLAAALTGFAFFWTRRRLA